MSPYTPEYYMPVKRHEAEWIQRDPDTAEARAWGEWFASHIAAFGIGALLVSLIWRHPGLSEGVLKWQRS